MKSKRGVKIKEGYFICLSCGTLTTSSELEEVCSNGGLPYCDCMYSQLVWNGKDFDYEVLGAYIGFKNIPKKIYDVLKTIKNDVVRLETFKQVPNKRR